MEVFLSGEMAYESKWNSWLPVNLKEAEIHVCIWSLLKDTFLLSQKYTTWYSKIQECIACPETEVSSKDGKTGCYLAAKQAVWMLSVYKDWEEIVKAIILKQTCKAVEQVVTTLKIQSASVTLQITGMQ